MTGFRGSATEIRLLIKNPCTMTLLGVILVSGQKCGGKMELGKMMGAGDKL